MKIAIGTDHKGTDVKKYIIDKFNDIDFIDCSPKNEPTDDYPDFAFKVANIVKEKKADFGILICGTGIGMSIAANKVRGIRCALVHTTLEAQLAKEHNDANVLAFSSNLEYDNIIDCINAYISAKTSLDEKHERRRQKLIKIEEEEYNEL